jgi:hypothetical protein
VRIILPEGSLNDRARNRKQRTPSRKRISPQKEPYPSSVEAPLSIGDTATATAEALWRLFPFSMGQQQGRSHRSGHSQRERAAAASILPEGSLNDSKIGG